MGKPKTSLAAAVLAQRIVTVHRKQELRKVISRQRQELDLKLKQKQQAMTRQKSVEAQLNSILSEDGEAKLKIAKEAEDHRREMRQNLASRRKQLTVKKEKFERSRNNIID